ncbi:MAG: cytochrome c biogenesis protein CcsA [Chthonomonas sp.]|nr:cytochrome c biogenesis protein CcsA [Chthonomonas sp.]
MNDINATSLMDPPSWSLTLGVIGRFLILGAAGFFALAGISWFVQPRWPNGARLGKGAFFAGCAALAGSFVSLGVLFANHRFEYEYVYGHSDLANALAYRIAGIWSGQEGSFLLWATCSAIFGLFTVGRTEHYRRWYTIVFSFFLGGIASILAFESPFNLNMVGSKPFVPADGLGLAPSLQNYWVIIHPPTIFLGFGSLTCLFALAVAALCTRDYERWIPIVRPWAIVATTLVGVGLCMGGFWAYETLGWGGFWMWDPVENVSFVPWCFAAALLHGVLVQATKKKWQMTNLLLGALPFLVFVYGTFLTRSGLLSDASVHSFAEMDRSALKLLTIVMGVSTLGFLGLWGVRTWQQRKVQAEASEAPTGLQREGFYMVGITLLLVMGIATAIGMSVPLVQALRGEKPRIVEEAVYHQVLVWIFVPIMLLLAITPFVAWRGMRARDLAARMYTILCITVGVTGLLLFLTVVTPFARRIEIAPVVTMLGRYQVPGLAWLTVLVGICLFALIGNVWCASGLMKRSKLGIAPFMTHVGLGLLMMGLIVSRGFERKAQTMVMQDYPGRLMNYEVRYAGMTSNEMDRNNKLKLAIYDPHKQGDPLFIAYPGLYRVQMADGQENTMVWPHIERNWLMDTYVSLGQPQNNASQDLTLKQGETVRFGEMMLTYKKMTRQGEPGQLGTKFGAEVTVESMGQVATVNPEMELGGDQGMVDHPVKIADNMELVMAGMDAADKSVRLRIQLTTPLYPVEIYHKPLTSLVWLGTGVMTLGGFLSAFYRRARRPVTAPESPQVAPLGAKPKRAPAMLGDKP